MYKITQNLNTWDTNYHVFDLDNRLDYLIDISDFVDEFGNVNPKTIELELLINLSWKVI